MKKILALLGATVIVFGLAGVALAQDAGPKGGLGKGGAQKGQRPGGGGQFGRIGKVQQEILAKLGLTPDQKKKVEALDAKTKAAVEEIMKNGKGQENRDKIREIMKNHRETMMTILTPEQKKKYMELMKEYREKNGGKFGGAAGAPAAGATPKGGKGKGGGGL